MCSNICLDKEKFMKKIHFKMQNAWMKQYLETPKQDGHELFYQQNQFNNVTVLQNFQSNKKFKKCSKFYPCRGGKCFPRAAPICHHPMRYRPAVVGRARLGKDVEIPVRKVVFKTYTRKLKMRPKEED
ncbi:unnamed protein product [Chironomus riparius]|uniref:Uncharacterized protein n=1 Tax=Chironomus riparius TaxID=315576 RepID=A0A9N9RKL6_9DIPT|nr:unnamed protein product [Chironomus riparius]